MNQNYSRVNSIQGDFISKKLVFSERVSPTLFFNIIKISLDEIIVESVWDENVGLEKRTLNFLKNKIL